MLSINRWRIPKDVTDLELAFGGRVTELLPAWDEIPDEFKVETSKWRRLAKLVFFGNLSGSAKLEVRSGIDPQKAGRHIQAIMRSTAPKHEHKIAGCAYLASLFFSDVIFTDQQA